MDQCDPWWLARGLVAVLLLGWSTPGVAAAPEPTQAGVEESGASPSFSKGAVPFLTKHCYACHGNGKTKGDLTLDADRDERAVEKNRKVWENVLEMIRAGEMPPKNRPRPTPEETEVALLAIDGVLNKLDCSQPRNVGRVTLRRLNRVEYNNTIRDLVGIDFKPAADFPNDDVGYGFDNIGDVLSLSPLLFEKYLTAAESILGQAIVTDNTPKPTKSQLGGIRATEDAGGEKRGFGRFLHSIGSFRAQSYFDEGDYTLKVSVFGHQVGDQPVRAVIRINGEDIDEFDVPGDRAEPTRIERKVRIKTGTKTIAVTFLNPYTDPKNSDSDTNRRLLFLRGIEMDGPYNPPPQVFPETHQRIMTHQVGLAPRDAAHEIVSRFAARAFRRPVQPGEVDQLMKLYDKGEAEGERFEDCVRLVLEAVLVWPDFLYRVELDPRDAQAGSSYPVSEFELASRLSYFLWSSMPDETLLSLAGAGRLRGELDHQLQRMLKDPKAVAFVENFSGQWLTIRKLAYVAPDAKEFPEFDDELRAAMYRETELFFESILREDRSILDFLDADYSFVNERLAKHYGMSGVEGKEFRRVKLPANRGGILTHASILTLTSNPTRTSPVKRGKWVLDQLLNLPPPPPPPDVPEFPEAKRLTGSLRKVMEMHREQPICASCHKRMDPIGFAFENYDATGAWRDKDGAFLIDPSGELPGGQSFQGPAELKTILRGKKELFSRCLAEKMLTYALGRGLEYYDKCAVDKILEALNQNGDRFSVLMAEVVKSEPFQMRTATGEEP
ncbi:Planctomycete cytochrome C [Singulisphaera sp. GP187]|uniref:DUF1592 domain-containing protein n=1 Tax=Singulisphaera sp. GP187 TaxID=1882752 RepID=UPI0009281158|nr:DUF1592 domain-containing protein [Singulisphaera sp. GP187]SIN98922.1 Planctomycete cytochrome C [Singulisphaera sp. GP187]